MITYTYWAIFIGSFLGIAYGILKSWYSDMLWYSLLEEQSFYLITQRLKA